MAVTEFVLTQEMRRQAIGIESIAMSEVIEKGAVARFAEAIEDLNPLWVENTLDRNNPSPNILAPPTFLRSIRYSWPQTPFHIPYSRLLDGGSQWEYFEPVRPGDQITTVACIKDMYQRSGHIGPMLIAINSISYTNQFDRTVAIQQSTIIRY